MKKIILFRFEHELAIKNHQIFSGYGATIISGRWHTAPRSIVYCADSIALAILEIRVHLLGVKSIPNKYLISVEIDKEDILEIEDYPEDWRKYPANVLTQNIGNKWFDNQNSLALKVRSSIVPESFNYLINCTHSHFAKLKPTKPQVYQLDPRLWS